MTKQIDLGLAVAIAGQVSAGLAPGDGQDERATAALVAIGLMVKNAASDKLVDDALDLAARSTVTRIGGGWRFETRLDEAGS